MSIALLIALALPACTPSMTEPEWPVDLKSIVPVVVDADDETDGYLGLGGKTEGHGGLGGKCELDMFGLPPDLAAVVGRARAVCRQTSPPPVEAAAVYEALYRALRTIPRRSFEVRSMQVTVSIMWHNEVTALAAELTRSTMRPTAKCVGPVP